MKLVRLFLIFALPALGHAQFTYTTNNDNTVTITGYTGSGGDVTIPDTINDLPVTALGSYAFSGTSVSNVTMSTNLTSIGIYAFNDCYGLNSVLIPANVTNVGIYAFVGDTSLTNAIIQADISNLSEGLFFNCSNLTGITISSAITNIGIYTLSQTGLTNFTIPTNVVSISSHAFDTCLWLNNITIGNSVTSIGGLAFYNCRNLTNAVFIPASVTNISAGAFMDTPAPIIVDSQNSYYSSLGGVLFNSNQTILLECPTSEAGTYNIPQGVTNIAGIAFAYCTSLTTVVIPNSIASIGGNAFAFCSSLTALYFEGNAPTGGGLFLNDSPTVYYLPGTTGWGSTFSGRPTVLWNPQATKLGLNFGLRTNQFGFIITGTSNITVVVQASTNLANPTWLPITTITLTKGASSFTDYQWTLFSGRFYRFTTP